MFTVNAVLKSQHVCKEKLVLLLVDFALGAVIVLIGSVEQCINNDKRNENFEALSH